jgi:hypothetical protein
MSLSPIWTYVQRCKHNHLSKVLSPLRLWVGFSLRTHVKRVSQRSAESRGFSPGAPVSSHRECWQDGLGLAPNWSFHRCCAPWSDMSHKVAAIGALRKPSTRSRRAASFVILLRSQLLRLMVRRWLARLHSLTNSLTSSSFIVIYSYPKHLFLSAWGNCMKRWDEIIIWNMAVDCSMACLSRYIFNCDINYYFPVQILIEEEFRPRFNYIHTTIILPYLVSSCEI